MRFLAALSLFVALTTAASGALGVEPAGNAGIASWRREVNVDSAVADLNAAPVRRDEIPVIPRDRTHADHLETVRRRRRSAPAPVLVARTNNLPVVNPGGRRQSIQENIRNIAGKIIRRPSYVSTAGADSDEEQDDSKGGGDKNKNKKGGNDSDGNNGGAEGLRVPKGSQRSGVHVWSAERGRVILGEMPIESTAVTQDDNISVLNLNVIGKDGRSEDPSKLMHGTGWVNLKVTPFQYDGSKIEYQGRLRGDKEKALRFARDVLKEHPQFGPNFRSDDFQRELLAKLRPELDPNQPKR